MVEVLDGRSVGDLFGVMRELGYAHATATRHGCDGPFLSQVLAVSAQIGPKQLDGALGVGQRGIERNAFLSEHFQQQQEKLIQVDGQRRDVAAVLIGLDGCRNASETRDDFLRCVPDRLLVVTKHFGQLAQVVGRQHDPRRPSPRLMGAANAKVKDPKVAAGPG